ncbi:MAG: alkyl hydroperoxide reductase subunit F [Betaproteobacteria bacterium]|nr:MAG: alkyl hydroperoxide reductase subunit F [Betaproteobacteria bacterium]
MLDADLKTQLKGYLERITHPIALVASVDDGEASGEMIALLRDVAEQSERVTLVRSDGVDTGERTPSFRIERTDTDIGVRFAALPTGHEFTSLVLALLQVGGYPPKLDADLVERIRALEGEFSFETYMSLTCQNCPDVVQALNAMSVLNPSIRHVAIDGALYQDEVENLGILSVPAVYLNGEPFGQGRMGVEEILSKLDRGPVARDAAKPDAKAPYDVLIVGGGPAGAAAAIYAARKGIRTGIVAERFGGQLIDTMAIENFVSVAETDGPKFAAALEQHVRRYDVEMLSSQRAEKLVPPAEPGGLAEVRLANGTRLTARSVVLATGARWRNIDVPGEQKYRNRGVAYCPHCDGPLFKGKRVAVIGGGNSGVEAAIDLAGIVEHVTLIEFAPQLKADAILVAKMKSLPNVDIRTNAQTIEITGDGTRVNGLRCVERATGEEHRIALAGVFVQIGLVPNTEWLKGSVELNRFGEIVVDAKGQTSAAGVFAAGDSTTAPYKQIIIATGEGAKAALSAFEHLIRAPLPLAMAA